MYPDTEEGLRAFMLAESSFKKKAVMNAKVHQDRNAPGVWGMVLRDEDRTSVVVYGLGTGDPDFEEVEFGPRELWTGYEG